MALGLDRAGFKHAALIDNDADCCATLRYNSPNWNVIQGDVRDFDARPYYGVDLLSGGIPCTPWSVGGKQRGAEDERNLLRPALRIIAEVQPRAVLIESVKGLQTGEKFDEDRKFVSERLRELGYGTRFLLLNATDCGLPQRRERLFIVAFREPECMSAFKALAPMPLKVTVGDLLYAEMASGGWGGSEAWRRKANASGEIAPTIVGGSKKHGGPDMGGKGTKAAWARLGIDGMGIADQAPGEDGRQPRRWKNGGRPSSGSWMPMLTVPMAALLQGFPDGWVITGKKTAAYKQVGNALPPPMACAMARAIVEALREGGRLSQRPAMRTNAVKAAE